MSRRNSKKPYFSKKGNVDGYNYLNNQFKQLVYFVVALLVIILLVKFGVI